MNLCGATNESIRRIIANIDARILALARQLQGSAG